MKLSQLLEKARSYGHVYLAGHIHPDGDCVGATLALVQLMENAGVKAKVLLMEKPEIYRYLPMDIYVQTEVPEAIDFFITLDSSDPERLGAFSGLVHKVPTVNIDHHISNTIYGETNYVDGNASSTCEMIYYMIDDMSWVNKAIAEALYTGMVYDTGGFKHTNTKPSTLMAAAELLKYEIDFNSILNRLFYDKPFKTFKAKSLAFDRLRLELDGRVAVSWLTADDFIQLDIVKEHVDSIVQHMNDIRGLEVAVFFYAVDQDKYKVSLRSKGHVDVCVVARAFGGGGHVKASGASFEGSVETCITAVLNEVKKQL